MPIPTASSDRSLPRWDESRSVAELEGRLLRAPSLALADPQPNLENVKALLGREAGRLPTAQSWVNAVALIQQAAENAPELNLVEYLRQIADGVAVWSNPETFVACSDKLTGKLVPAWFSTTLQVKGAEYLIVNTQKMPYRLWGITERLLDKGLKEQFVKLVKQAFKEDKLTVEHYYWMWRAPKSDPDRARLLAKPYVLFRLLGRELKGNYLKSQRELRRLLLNDVDFQKAVTLDGDETISRDLINCARRVLLLDANERQALLVKLCRLYGYLAQYVADGSKKKQLNIPPQSSVRSCRELQRRLQNLIDVEIPANEDAIKTAKGHGDLSENSEFKAAKERQRELGKLRAQLEQQVANITATDFANVTVNNTVIPGCVVTIRYVDDDHTEDFTILGLLDNDPDRNCISYDTPLGRTLLAKEIGDQVTLPNQKKAVIEALAALSPELLAVLKG